jgi:hypothetical protein
MHDLRRAVAALAACLFYLVVVACRLAPAGGMAERCANLMKEAYPGADINITKSTAAATSLTTVVARVEGDRTNLPSHPPTTHHLAVECRFDNDVLTGFRWTAGPK